MEQTQLETLRSLASFFPLPQHRPRRLLKSETFATLVRMRSLFHDEFLPTHCNKDAEISEPGFQNGKDEEIWTRTIESEPRDENTCSTSLETAILPNQKEAQSSVGSGLGACVNVDSNGIGASENRMNYELFHDVVNELGNLMGDGKGTGGDICLGSNQENDNLGIELDVENEKGKDLNNKNDSFPTMEAIMPSWDMDSMIECLMHDEKDERNSLTEQKISQEIWQDDSMELEKFLSDSNLNDLLPKNVIDEEMEEGEILYEIGDLDQPLDCFLEEAGLSENVNDDEQPVSEFIRNVEPLTSNNTNDLNQKDLRSNESMIAKGKILNFDYKNEDNIKKADGHDFLIAAAVSKNNATTIPRDSDNPESSKRVLEEIVAETETETAEQVADTRKKRKRGPASKQRKKKKERIKRAENNRRLGVKRLKIVPISKPKVIVYCRHFVNGRCHEGENCKFSHDIVPLTKSQPCCYFARHTCMKGDDCPFDHELSKYPCNNFVSKGYCNRGSDCMFSHQVQPTSNSSEITTPELKPLGSLENKGPKKQTNAPPSKKIEKTDAETVLKHSVKGIDKLLFGIGSLHNHSIASDSTEPCIEKHGKKAHSTPSSNAVTETRRINFLSFGKSPVSDLKSNGSSNLFHTARDDVSTNIAVAASSLQQKEGESCQNEMPEKPTTQSRLPRGINFMSFGTSQTTASQENHGKKAQAIPNFNAMTESRRVNFLSYGKSHDLNTNGSSNLFYTTRDEVSTNIAVATSSLQQKEDNSCQNEMPEKPTKEMPLPCGINFMTFGASQTTASQDTNVIDKKIPQMPISTESDNLTFDLGKGLLSSPGSKPPAPLLSTSTLAMKGHHSNLSQNTLMSMLAFADKYKSKIKTMNRAGNGPTKGS